MNETPKGPRPVNIIVNTRHHAWAEKQISYEQAVALAYPGEAPTDTVAFTVRYSRGPGGHGAGTLTTGQSVRVKEGMIFDVVRTTRS